MATPATMRQLEDRQVDRAVIKMLWSPKMDILVVVFETNDISLFRLNWQRVSKNLIQNSMLPKKFPNSYEWSLIKDQFGIIETLKRDCCLLMPCPFTGPKMFCAGPNFLAQTKNLFTYFGSHKHFVPEKKMICIQ